MAVRMCATVALLFALALQGCSFGNADGNEKDTPKEDSGAAAPAELTEIDRVLAGLRKRMTKAEITRAFDARGVDGFPIFYRIADPDWHLNFYGSDSGHVTFVFDADEQLISWKRWDSDRKRGGQGGGPPK